MSKKANSYNKLCQLSKKGALLSTIFSTLEWDQETMMPSQAIGLRSEQTELLAGLIHQEKLNPEFIRVLGELIDLESGAFLADDFSALEKGALRRWRRAYLHASKLPTSFVEEYAKVASASVHAWQTAKPENDFATFQPHLEKIVEMNLQKADYLGFQDHPYDALADEYEPGQTAANLTHIFEKLKIPLLDLIKKIQTKPDPDRCFLFEYYPREGQIKIARQILQDMGFFKGVYRLDESIHPFCSPIHPKDMRMTTHVLENNILSTLLSTAHEGGHGLYHTNIPDAFFGTPLVEAASLATDESQSRTWETIIGRSRPFWTHYFPLLQEAFPTQLGTFTTEEFYQGVNVVEPSMIRTESDEVCYNLHILLRFELEMALLDRTLKTKEIPEAWNEKMRAYLSLTPKAMSEGCMQDIHWAMGGFGYFPTYTLGNLYAGQYFASFTKDNPDWEEKVASGDLTTVGKWQRDHIHSHGAVYEPEELCKRVTGAPLSEEPFIQYLTKKYTALYQL